MKTIHHVCDIEAEPGRVWWALTDREGMASWWSTRVESPEAGVGAMIKWTFAGDFNPVMEITELVEPTTLVWRCVGGHEPWADNLFRFELQERGASRTRLRFWQEYARELDDDAYGTYNYNWGYYLESLRLLTAEGIGKPFGIL
jgi:uncharacterized protein YndB with AHSA1/START domain